MQIRYEVTLVDFFFSFSFSPLTVIRVSNQSCPTFARPCGLWEELTELVGIRVGCCVTVRRRRLVSTVCEMRAGGRKLNMAHATRLVRLFKRSVSSMRIWSLWERGVRRASSVFNYVLSSDLKKKLFISFKGR